MRDQFDQPPLPADKISLQETKIITTNIDVDRVESESWRVAYSLELAREALHSLERFLSLKGADEISDRVITGMEERLHALPELFQVCSLAVKDTPFTSSFIELAKQSEKLELSMQTFRATPTEQRSLREVNALKQEALEVKYLLMSYLNENSSGLAA